MLGLLTSNRQRQYDRPPGWPSALNTDCAQAQGLAAFWPLGYSRIELNARTTADMSPTIEPAMMTMGEIGLCRNFTRASTQYLELTTPTVTAPPFTMAIWAHTIDTTNDQVSFAIGDTAAVTNYFGLGSFGGTAGDPVTFFLNGGGAGQVNANTATGYSSGRWHHQCGVATSTTDRAVFINGGSKGTNTTSRTPVSLDNTTIGVLKCNALFSAFGGNLAHACIWDRALSDGEVAALHDPETRWELYYPIGRKTWSFASSATGNRRRRLICGAA